jgi:hypothetical protein
LLKNCWLLKIDSYSMLSVSSYIIRISHPARGTGEVSATTQDGMARHDNTGLHVIDALGRSVRAYRGQRLVLESITVF